MATRTIELTIEYPDHYESPEYWPWEHLIQVPEHAIDDLLADDYLNTDIKLTNIRDRSLFT